MTENRNIIFELGGMLFEYDEEKNKTNIEKHGISFKIAARVFFDYNRIEIFDENNSKNEERYDTIGNIQAGNICNDDILFVVYTERVKTVKNNEKVDVIRIISARFATNAERRIYYGND